MYRAGVIAGDLYEIQSGNQIRHINMVNTGSFIDVHYFIYNNPS